ncbi:hypothetical protein REPUB_Repub10bG0081700 [Reevesia pubescens]
MAMTNAVVIFLIIYCLAILPEKSCARHHNPYSPPRPETPASISPAPFSTPPQHHTLPPSPKKSERYEGEVYYLPPDRV